MDSAVVSTHQQSHACNSCGPSPRLRDICGNGHNLVHKAAPVLLTLKDVCTLFKSPWPIYTSLFILLTSHGGRSGGQIRWSSSSIWGRPSLSANTSDESKVT